jgi:hypothetical protein
VQSPPAWMCRDNPSYDPNRIGAVTQIKVMAALVEAGKVVLIPCVDVRSYDLVIEDAGRFHRVQCKTGRLFRGAVYFRPHRLRAARRETGWERRVTDYKGHVDYFGVYCPENGKVYLVPLEAVTRRACSLRLTPARNRQNKRIRWARDFEVKPAAGTEPAAEKPALITELITEGP